MDINEFKRAFFDVACDMQKLLHDLVAPACQRNGLTLQQMHVLVELVSAPGQTSTQLSERAGILRTNFSSVCHKLEERGLEIIDLEYDVHAFQVHLPRLHIIDIDDFDPMSFL